MSLQICFFGLATLDSDIALLPLLEVLKWRSAVPHANVIDECAKCCASLRLRDCTKIRQPEL